MVQSGLWAVVVGMQVCCVLVTLVDERLNQTRFDIVHSESGSLYIQGLVACTSWVR